MKPNFALNLSHDGISLLHRAKAGWMSVGGVSLDDPGLVDELGVLRRTAADLEAGGLTTKLVIPDSQILYTEVDAPGPTTTDRIAQIRDGLVGLTPYDVRDLVFDWRKKGKRAQVAVVARETLQEAEAFAIQYRFNPVSFVAAPSNGAFEGEPFFGPTRHAAAILTGGESVQPDAETIHVISPGEPPQPPGKPKHTPKPNPKPKAAKAGPDSDAGGATPAGAPADTEPQDNRQAAAPAAEKGAGPAAKPEPAFSHRQSEPPAPTPRRDRSAGDAEPPVTFSSRRANGQAAAIPPTTRATPEFLPKAATDPAPAVRAAPLPPVPPRRTPMPVTAPDTADAAPKQHRKSGGTARTTGAALAGALGRFKRGSAPGPVPPSGRETPPPAVAPGSAPVPPPAAAKRGAATEAEAMTVFGARGRPQVRGKPRYLGLALTLILLLALAVLALWSTYFMSDVTQGWFGTFEDEPQIAVSEPGPGIAAPSPVELATTPLPSETAQPADPEPAPGEAALTGDAPSAAEAAPDVSADPPEQTAIDAAVETALTGAPAPEADVTPADETLETARLQEPPAAERPLPETDAPAPVVRRPLTRPEAEARYAATGVWQLDPDPPTVPGSDRVDELVLAAVDPAIGTPGSAALPPESGLDTDLRPSALAPPAPLGIQFDLDDRGLVRATEDGAVTPGGYRVFLGAPPYVPGGRPEDLPVPQEETALDGPLSEETPQPPDSAGTQTAGSEAAGPGDFASLGAAAIRPAIRPASLWVDPGADTAGQAPTAEEQAEIAAEEAADLADATDLAVAASATPAVRPRNFASLVDEALEEAARTQPAPQPEAERQVAAARVPSIPTRASVAKQATEANAINLRKVNLIGVYGTPSNRSALIRLKNGKFVKVSVGDRVDGGRVAAIGDNELRYVKGGRNITLKLPRG